MSKSYRTDQPRVVAARRLERTAGGELVLPRIVVRRPPDGDHHPLPASALRRVMSREIPAEYVYGLSRIELRPRQEGAIGMPFACYLRDEKAIILYSLPKGWVWESPPAPSLIAGMRRFYAFVKEHESEVHVQWPAPEVLAMWYFIEVFAHELGHHYRNQYRIRRGGVKSTRHEEYVAELHSGRFYDSLVRTLKAKR